MGFVSVVAYFKFQSFNFEKFSIRGCKLLQNALLTLLPCYDRYGLRMDGWNSPRTQIWWLNRKCSSNSNFRFPKYFGLFASFRAREAMQTQLERNKFDIQFEFLFSFFSLSLSLPWKKKSMHSKQIRLLQQRLCTCKNEQTHASIYVRR